MVFFILVVSPERPWTATLSLTARVFVLSRSYATIKGGAMSARKEYKTPQWVKVDGEDFTWDQVVAAVMSNRHPSQFTLDGQETVEDGGDSRGLV